MMMMDISMYGHHNQHSAAYNSTDSNYYNYSSELNHSGSHHQFQTHYAPNYHYEEPSYLYGATVTDTADTPPSPQDLNYYHPQQMQDNPIINTDTGLSYTNLDYANSNSNTIYHHQNSYNENYRTHPSDILIQHHEESSDNHHLQHSYPHENKYHNHQVELDGNYHHSHLVAQNAQSNACMEFQHLHRYKEELLQGPEGHRLRQHHAMHGMNAVPQPQPVLPTYKWMQVKRNVPKPADYVKALLDIEVAQLYLLFHHVSKAKEHIISASGILGIHYKLIGALGKRTKYQEKEIAQLSLKVTVEEKNGVQRSEEDIDSNIPKNIPLNDDVRLNSVEFSSKDSFDNVSLTVTEQKLFVTIVQEMLIAKPQDELQTEELHPFIDLILNQRNSFSVRVITLLLRCKLESKNKRTIERSLAQCEEIVGGSKRESPHFLNRVVDVFGIGMPPMWKVEAQLADLLLNVGLVKNALDIYLKVKLWEEVIVCYTILKLRHKAAEVIQEQLNVKPTVKLLCLLGDATDDVTCYEKAWEMSKRRSHRAQRHWGQYLFLRKQYEQCIPHFEKSVSINPLQSVVWFRLGFAALQTENWQTAATAYRRYTTLEPDGFEAWNNLAQAYLKIGNKRNAHQAILEALKCNFENWKVWENLLVVSCDISNFSDVIRAYHKLLDIKEKYINIEVLNVLVYSVCNDVNDNEGQPSQRFLKKTRELLGRVTAIYPGEGYVWELYASLAPATLLRAQRLQRAYRGYSQGAWEKSPATCQQVLYVCSKLAEIVLDNDIDPKDSLINSIKLNLSSAVSAIRKQDWEDTRELVDQVSADLEKITEKIKNSGSDVKLSRT